MHGVIWAGNPTTRYPSRACLSREGPVRDALRHGKPGGGLCIRDEHIWDLSRSGKFAHPMGEVPGAINMLDYEQYLILFSVFFWI